MGLSSSQARLLTITTRLTSNEYESQQISNAKMRLATQSQLASEEYLSALNKQLFNIISYDNTGNQISTPLTAASLYEYNDTKNQYILSNSSGKVLLSSKDIFNYENSNDLESFLEKYGLKKIFKTSSLEDAYKKVRETMGYDQNNNYNASRDYKSAYENEANRIKSVYTTSNWINGDSGWNEGAGFEANIMAGLDPGKNRAQQEYLNRLHEYNLITNLQSQGYDISNDDVNDAKSAMEFSRDIFMTLISYESAIENKLKGTSVYDNYQEYKSALALYTDELGNEGETPASAYQWDDKTKAQWYTNLWYKINGSSSGNMHTNNYSAMDYKMMNSTSWVSDAILKGIVNIESVSYKETEMGLNYGNDPFIFKINGITWNSKIYSSCSDIVAANNEKLVAKAEAEYKQKTAEINAKDEKYQRKLSLLDSEHHAIQTEYDSVKSAIEKNISRSFKAFQG